MKKCLYKYNGNILMLITQLDTCPLNEVLTLINANVFSHHIRAMWRSSRSKPGPDENVLDRGHWCQNSWPDRDNLLIPKVRGEWPVKQEVLKDERCARASLRGGVFNLQAPVNTVSEGQEAKPAIYSSKSTVHHQLITIAGFSSRN